jgi:hypothetical protein
MRSSILLFSVPFILTGCSIFGGMGREIGWNDAIPPVPNGIGRQVQGKSLGQYVFDVDSSMIEELESYRTANFEKNEKYRAAVDAAYKQVTANAGFEFISEQAQASTNWRVFQLKNFNGLVPDKQFAYKCLTTDSYSYSVSRKNSGGVKLDASEIAKEIGISAASIEISKSPTKPGVSNVTVENPTVCLAFVSARFKRAGLKFNRNDLPRDFMVEGRKIDSLTADEGEYAVALPDFGPRAFLTKPKYHLFATDNNGLITLKIRIEDRETFKELPHIVVPAQRPGYWNTSVQLPTFHVQDEVYGKLWVQINATQAADNQIKFKSAKLFSPEYKLVVD